MLKKAGIEVAFRGQNKKNPCAPGQLSDWYFIENVHHNVKQRIVKAVNASSKWMNGVSPAKRRREERVTKTVLGSGVYTPRRHADTQ